jgi:3-hydroxy-9,10-secoandrosta-1,3,5(10)-triene-9,17-dione monooxygenase reductase component
MEMTSDHLRRLWGSLPTGVTVITANSSSGPMGMAVNSFTSVSLNPPLALVCASKVSRTWPAIRAGGRLCVNVMSHGHESLSRRFSLKDVDRFAGVEMHQRECGPGLSDAVAWFDCEIDAEHDGGDHTIVVVRMLDVEVSADAAPLVFFRGRYGTFSATNRE